MIQLTRFNDETLVVNVDLVVRIEANPDTILHMTNGDMLKVREAPEEVVERTIDYKKRVFAVQGSNPQGGR